MQTTLREKSRFNRLTAMQRAAVLAATVTAIVLVFLLLAEAAVEIRHKIKYGFWGIEETYTLDQGSGLRIPIPGGHFGPISINSLGFRSPEIPVAKPPGRLRIAFLGGSTTYCAEVSSNQMTWPNLVWTDLQHRFPGLDIDYINGGVPGFSTVTLKRNLEQRIARLQPDFIVIYEATNDLSGNSYVLAKQQGVTFHTMDDQMSWLASHSLFVYLIEKNLAIWQRQRETAPSVASRQVVIDQSKLESMFRDSLTALIEASKRVADLVAVATFAPRLRDGQSPEELRAAAITNLYYMPYMTPETILDGFRHYNNVIRDVAANENALLVGADDTIAADGEHYTDSVHFTDAGSIQMAKRVVDALLKSDQFLSLVTERGYQAKDSRPSQ